MTPSLLALFVGLSANSAILYSVRAKNGQLVTLQTSSESPELAKGQTFGQFVPNELETQFIELVQPKIAPKADPMVNRLKKSEIVKPVQFVLNYVLANPTKTRKDLIAELVELGIATYTARTQVQVGLKRIKLLAELARKVELENAEKANSETETETDTETE
jgi:hypothetical protein